MIAAWYEENYHGFADKYNAAVKNVQPMLPDADPDVIHYWKDATIEDL
ncbi:MULTISPECIES: hypothetical protein [unclassified Methanosarcina]|nr:MULTISPECIES: hypothetical protein [unclassified Methanosarcina]